MREGREINYDEEIVAEVSDAPDVDSEDEKGGGLRAPSRWPSSSHTRHTGYRPYFEDSESDFSTRSLSSDEEVEVREHALCSKIPGRPSVVCKPSDRSVISMSANSFLGKCEVESSRAHSSKSIGHS